MADTRKSPSRNSHQNSIRAAFNDHDKSLTVSEFVTAKVGHKITTRVVNTTTDEVDYHDGTSLIMTVRIIYTDTTKSKISSQERVV